MSVTIRDIARASGYAPSTVSQALSNTGSLKRKTREHIREVARKLGYYDPVEAIGTHVDVRGKSFFIVMPGSAPVPPVQEHEKVYAETFPGRVLKGIGDALESVRAVPILMSGNQFISSGDNERVATIVVGGNVDAELTQALRQSEPPVVVVGSHVPANDIAAVEVDFVSAIRDVVRHLVELGHRRIALLNGPPTTLTSDQKLTGFVRAAFDHGLDAGMIAAVENSQEAAKEKALALLTSAWREATAIVCAYETLAIGVLHAAYELGISIPGDLSVTACHDDGPSMMAIPPLTTAALPSERMGRLAVSLALSVGSNRDLDGVRLVVAPDLVVRSSTGPPGK